MKEIIVLDGYFADVVRSIKWKSEEGYEPVGGITLIEDNKIVPYNKYAIVMQRERDANATG